MLATKLGRDIHRLLPRLGQQRVGSTGTTASSNWWPRRWSTSGSGTKPTPSAEPPPPPQLTLTPAELERVVERAVGRIAKDVARNTERIQQQSRQVAANTESRLSAERRLWSETAMEAKIEKVHDALVREEARLQQWVDLGITGLKSGSPWNRYSIGVAGGIVVLLAVFKTQIYNRLGKEAAELTGAAISDTQLLDRIQQLIVAIGKSPETVHALTELLKTVFKEAIVLDSLVDLTKQLLANDTTRQSLNELLVTGLFGEPEVRQAAGDFVIGALAQEETKAALQELIREQLHDLLRDERTHYEAAAASKSTLGRTFWWNRKPDGPPPPPLPPPQQGAEQVNLSDKPAVDDTYSSTTVAEEEEGGKGKRPRPQRGSDEPPVVFTGGTAAAAAAAAAAAPSEATASEKSVDIATAGYLQGSTDAGVA